MQTKILRQYESVVEKNPYVGYNSCKRQLKATLSDKVFLEERLNSRVREYVEDRAQWIYFLYKYTNMSLSSVGKLFKRDHATMLNAIKKYLEVYLLYDRKKMYNHNVLTQIFDDKAERNKSYIETRGIISHKKYGIVSEEDILITKQRDLIQRLMTNNLELRHELEELKTSKKINGRIRKTVSANI